LILKNLRNWEIPWKGSIVTNCNHSGALRRPSDHAQTRCCILQILIVSCVPSSALLLAPGFPP
jgi:hypothetical protein